MKKAQTIRTQKRLKSDCDHGEEQGIDLPEAVNALMPEQSFNGLVLLSGEITEESGIGFLANCVDSLLDNPEGPLLVGINSPGGCYRTSMMIVDFLQGLDREVVMFNIGYAFSGGCLVFLAGDRRFAFPHAKFMLHSVIATKLSGNNQELKLHMEDMKKHDDEMNKFILKNSKIKKAELLKKFSVDDWFFSAQQSVKMGVAHKINSNIIKEMLRTQG